MKKRERKRNRDGQQKSEKKKCRSKKGLYRCAMFPYSLDARLGHLVEPFFSSSSFSSSYFLMYAFQSSNEMSPAHAGQPRARDLNVTLHEKRKNEIKRNILLQRENKCSAKCGSRRLFFFFFNFIFTRTPILYIHTIIYTC